MPIPSSAPRPKSQAVARGLRLTCPACGRGRLLTGYLRPAAACPSCGEPLGHLRADDAAPWMTILIVGHIVVPLVLSVEQTWHPALWVHATLWPLVTLGLTLAILPRCKGVVLGLLWATGAGEARRD